MMYMVNKTKEEILSGSVFFEQVKYINQLGVFENKTQVKLNYC